MSKPCVLNSTDEVITALGGAKAVAGLTRSKYTAVLNWRGTQKGRFPADTFLILNAALASIGKAAPPSLWAVKLPGDAA